MGIRRLLRSVWLVVVVSKYSGVLSALRVNGGLCLAEFEGKWRFYIQKL